ncbi:MAG: DUF3276 family protein [Bacteroidetes bacterium]|nr:DUF3276 family protein [Bacteroidota bacterium]
MAYDNSSNYNGNGQGNDRNNESIYSKRVKAGKRRTYFFDVRATRGNDYFITITESKKRFEDGGYDRHKMFIYKEDFNKFLAGLAETIDYVKTELMPDFDFDSFSHENDEEYQEGQTQAVGEAENYQAAPAAYATETITSSASNNNDADLDDWKM